MSCPQNQLICDRESFEPIGEEVVANFPDLCDIKQRFGFGDSVRLENLTASFHDTTKDCLRSIYNSYGVTYSRKHKNSNKCWSLGRDDDGLEEELYFSKNLAVQSTNKTVNRVFTLDELIVDFFPVHFVVEQKETTDYHYEVLANTTDESEDFEHLFSSGFAKTIPLQFKIRKGENNTVKLFKRKRALCAVDKNSLRIFCEDGDHWDKQLDFQIRSIVCSDYGIILERSLMKPERDIDSKFILYPTVYTISHFHGDVCPVWKIMPKSIPSANHYFSRLDQMDLLEFIASEDIAVFYSYSQKRHLFFYMRPVTNSELEMMQEVLHRKRQNSTKNKHSDDENQPEDLRNLLNTTPPRLDATMDMSRSFSFHQSMNHSLNHNATLSGAVESQKSPYSSTIMTRSKSQRVMKTLSEIIKTSQSPSKLVESWATLHESNFHSSIDKSADPANSSLDFHSIRVNNSMNDINEMSLSLKRLSVKSPNKIEGKDGDSPEDIEVFGILPEYCMIHFGMDETQTNFIAEKCFSMIDLMGRKYICLLTKNNEGQSCLKMIVYTSSSNNIQPQIGETLTIFVNDAEPIPDLRLLLVLDYLGNFSLYSGNTPLCNISLNNFCDVPTDVASNADFKTPLLTKKFQFASTSSFFSSKTTPSSVSKSPHKTTHNASTPKMNVGMPLTINSTPTDGVYPSAKPLEQAFMSPSTGFSPVSGAFLKTAKSQAYSVEHFENVVGKNVVFKTANGKFSRFQLPDLFEDYVVKQCFTALLQTLDEASANELVASWYSSRSTNVSKNKDLELELFKMSILKLVGYSKWVLIESHPILKKCSSEQSKPSFKSCSRLMEVLKDSCLDENEGSTYFDNLRYSSLSNQSFNDNAERGKLRNSLVNLQLQFDSPHILFEHLPVVLKTLHLVYEDFKLANSSWQSAHDIADLLYLLACDLKLEEYCQYYKNDFPYQCPDQWRREKRIDSYMSCLIFPKDFARKPLSIYERFEQFFNPDLMSLDGFERIPFIGSDVLVKESKVAQSMELVTVNIFKLTYLFANFSTCRFVRFSNVLECYGNSRQLGFAQTIRFDTHLVRKIKKICNDFNAKEGQQKFTSPLLWSEKILHFMIFLKIDSTQLSNIPIGISTPLLNVIWSAKNSPKTSWSTEIYKLLDRYDLILQDYEKLGSRHIKNRVESSELTFKNNFVNSKHPELNCFDQETLLLMFPEDQRIQDAFELLVSSKPVIIKCKQLHGVSDTDFLDQQEKILNQITPRTQAKCIGRGMVTLNTFATVCNERIDIPPLCLTGQSESYKTAIELSNFDPNNNYWPIFHNGCAAGLRIRNNGIFDSSWIQFNKPKANVTIEDLISHAGFLFAMGLNGMMPSLKIINVYDYLANNNDFTNVAVMLGLAAARRGTSDNMTYKILSLRLECLLPPTSTDLEISPMCRIASCMGLGLLFQGTANSFISETLLNDIGKPPGPEMDNYMDRESYSLTAGIALGMITLGKGNSLDPYISPDGNTIPVQLNHYMLGAHKKTSCIVREQKRPASFHVQEGKVINSNVTAPGAILALGLMYFNSNNPIITSWMEVPETQILLEYIRPDFLFLRMIAHSLINWNKVVATGEWIMSHFPAILQDFFGKEKENIEKPQDFDRPFDYKLLGQSFCNILAGVSFSLALKYAGSHNLEAFSLINQYIQKIFDSHQAKTDIPFLAEAGKFTLETTVNSLLISCSIIMSGSGNIDILRLCRFLHYRTTRDLTYGNFMAVHMALGLNFLGSCKLTLNNSPESLPLLIMAFYPKFPSTTNDNRYHLQMFRHLYVLAVEPRLLLAKSVDLKAKVYASIRFTFKDPSIEPLELQTPCQVPQLDQLASIDISDNNFWSVSYSTPAQMRRIRNILRRSGIIFVKQRLNTLVYSEKELFSGKCHSFRERFLQLHMPKSGDSFDHGNDVLLKRFFLRFIFNKSNLNSREFCDTRKLYRLMREFLDDETFAMLLPFLELFSAFCSLVDLPENDQHVLRLPTNDRLRQQKSLLLWQIRFIANTVQCFDNVPPKVSFFYSMASRFVDAISNCGF